jgi:hypothetical protein
MQSPLGGPLDSLQTTNKLALGGVTLAAQWMLQDNFARDTLPPPAWQTRIALGAQARFESLPIDSARTLGTISPARGSGVTVHTAMDFWHGRFGGTIVAQYDKSFARTIQASVVGNPEAFYPFPTFAFVPRTLGDVVTLDLTPRYLLSPWFSIDGVYGYERTGASTYSLPADDPANPALFTPNPNAQVAQRIGFGFRYSTVDAYLRGATKTPVEVSYTHLETISGDLGTNKIFRDQIQLRIYVNLFGKH